MPLLLTEYTSGSETVTATEPHSEQVEDRRRCRGPGRRRCAR